MSQHTLGPWKTDDVNPDGAIPIYANGLLLAVCRYSQNPKITKENAQANARLIAAAPELLAALRTAESQIRALAPQGYIPPALGTIHAAIAKATGVTE